MSFKRRGQEPGESGGNLVYQLQAACPSVQEGSRMGVTAIVVDVLIAFPPLPKSPPGDLSLALVVGLIDLKVFPSLLSIIGSEKDIWLNEMQGKVHWDFWESFLQRVSWETGLYSQISFLLINEKPLVPSCYWLITARRNSIKMKLYIAVEK